MGRKRDIFFNGLRDGLPVAMGYLAVAFTLGSSAAAIGLSPFEVSLMSAINNTSAGEFSAFTLMAAGTTAAEIALTTLILNMRYFLMSCALSQKLDKNTPFFHRFLLSFAVTDEIFGLSVTREGKLEALYSYGIMAAALPAWTIGTYLGAVMGSVMPANVSAALNMAVYVMFIAVIMPPAKKDKTVALVVAVSMAASLVFSLIPALEAISGGVKVIILTVAISLAAAVIFPVENKEKKEPSAVKPEIFAYIFIAAGVTYLIRLLPFALVNGEIKNVTVRSFLYYVPYVTLSVMTFPAVLTATGSVLSASAGFAAALFTSLRGRSMFVSALAACAAVFLTELLIL